MRRVMQSRSGLPLDQPEFFSADVVKARRFYLNLKPAAGERLSVVCGGVEHCSREYQVKRSHFPFYSIEYVAQGGGELVLGGGRHALEPGMLFAYGPEIAHSITATCSAPLVKYFVDFAGSDSAALLASCDLRPGHVSKVFPPYALQNLFDELIDTGTQYKHNGGLLCARLLECMILKLAGIRVPLEGGEELAFSTYQKARQLIAERFEKLRTLQDISRECHVSEAHLCRVFRRYDRLSPYQFLLRVKMNAAAQRLSEPGALVKQVAEEMGFCDQFHFSRVFKSVLGMPPVLFRKLHRLE
jgi:AraC-like DNA-binding protein